MFYKIGKKLFSILIDSVQVIRLLLIFDALFTVIYWMLQLGQVQFIVYLAPLFEPIKSFMHIFYNRTVTIDTATIDFSFFVAALLMLVVSYYLKFVVAQIENVEKNYDKLYEKAKKKAEELFNIHLENAYVQDEVKNKNFLIMISAAAKNLAKNEMYSRTANEGMEEKQKEFMNEFYKIFHSQIKTQTKLADDIMIISCSPF